MNTSSNASTDRRNPMPKPFTAIVPPSFKAASETYQYAPAVRIGDQILISGIVGGDAEGRLPPDFRSQAKVGVTQLGVPGALLEISAVAVARDQDVDT